MDLHSDPDMLYWTQNLKYSSINKIHKTYGSLNKGRQSPRHENEANWQIVVIAPVLHDLDEKIVEAVEQGQGEG